jgi:hypothetical protein
MCGTAAVAPARNQHGHERYEADHLGRRSACGGCATKAAPTGEVRHRRCRSLPGVRAGVARRFSSGHPPLLQRLAGVLGGLRRGARGGVQRRHALRGGAPAVGRQLRRAACRWCSSAQVGGHPPGWAQPGARSRVASDGRSYPAVSPGHGHRDVARARGSVGTVDADGARCGVGRRAGDHRSSLGGGGLAGVEERPRDHQAAGLDSGCCTPVSVCDSSPACRPTGVTPDPYPGRTGVGPTAALSP